MFFYQMIKRAMAKLVAMWVCAFLVPGSIPGESFGFCTVTHPMFILIKINVNY